MKEIKIIDLSNSDEARLAFKFLEDNGFVISWKKNTPMIRIGKKENIDNIVRLLKDNNFDIVRDYKIIKDDKDNKEELNENSDMTNYESFIRIGELRGSGICRKLGKELGDKILNILELKFNQDGFEYELDIIDEMKDEYTKYSSSFIIDLENEDFTQHKTLEPAYKFTLYSNNGELRFGTKEGSTCLYLKSLTEPEIFKIFKNIETL